MADIRRISTLRVGILQPFDGDRIRHFLVHFFGGDAGKAERRYRQLERVKDLLGLSNNPRMLGFIAQLPAERLDAAEQREGGISAATLYRELIDYWLDYEIQRANPRGSPEGLTKEQCLRALHHLAERLWARTDRAIGLEELSEGVAHALGRLDHLDPEIATQLVGSGTLLVRDAEGRFSFLHQSALEWLVADEVARQLSTEGGSKLLERGEMSALMVEFLCDLAGRERAVDWAKRGLALQSKRGDAAQKNALAVIRWLKVEEGLTAMLAGADLQGQDLSGRNLRGADLRGANLRGARLSGADLTGAVLSRAVLSEAVLDEACLRDADLTSVEATGARFSGADLRGARLDGATLRRASLLGARVEPAQLEKARDLFGAAEPAPDLSAVHPVLASASGFARVLAWSPDDSLIAAGNIDGTLRVYSAADGSLLRVLTGGRGTFLNVAFMDGGQQLVAGWNDGSVWQWTVSTGQLRRVLHTGEGRAYLIAFCSSSSEPLAAISVGSGEIEVWSLQQGEVVRHLVDDEGRIRALAFLPDGQSLISGNTKGEILLWPLSGDSGAHRLAQRDDDVIKSLAFSPDGKHLAVGSGQVMELMSMATTEVVHRFEGTREGSRMPVFSPDGRRLASALSNQLQVWSVPEGKLLHQWEVEPEGLSSLAFSSDGQKIAADGAHSLRVWSASEVRILRTLNENSAWLRSAAFSPTGTHLATSSTSGRIRLWSTSQGKLHYDMDIGSERPNAVGVSANLQYLACGSRNGLVRVWSLADGKHILTMGTDSQRLESLAFSADGAVLAGGDDEGLVRLWSVPDGRLLRKHHVGDEVLVRKVKFSTDGKLLAACGGRSVEIYEVISAAHRRTLDLHMEQASSLAFSADDQLIAIGDTHGGIQLWFAQSGTLKETLRGHDRMVLELAFSSDNRMLASVSSDGSICLWSVADGQLACSLGSHCWVESMCFSPDSERLHTISADGTLRFWDVRTGKLVSTVLPLGNESWVLMAPNGRHLAHGKVGDALAYAINLVRFTPEEVVRYFPELRLPEGTGFLGPFGGEGVRKGGS
jgi:WD40 repeat protein/uncharacterized protein YjbI with pentapeptide repeats